MANDQEGSVHGALPDGIKHLHGAMYLVRFNLLQVPDPDAKVEAPQEGQKKYEFRNPRTLTERGQSVLFDKQKSVEMRESIRERTLLTPFLCRWKDGHGIQMVGGERRHRALSWLIHKKELVKDPRTQPTLDENNEPVYEYNPADQVYEYVACVIFHAASDMDALALSYTENDCRVNQGPGHDIAMVMELRQCGASDEKIMGIMSKDEKWLRDTDAIITTLDDATLRDVIEDNIERDAALQIISIKEKYNEDVQTKAVAFAKDAADKDYKRRYERFTRSLDDALTEKELAEGAVAEADFQGTGLPEAGAALGEATQKVQRIAKDRASDKPKVTPSNVKGGLRVIVGEEQSNGEDATSQPSHPRPPAQPKSLRYAKIKEAYEEPLDALVKAGGKHPELGEVVASQDAVKLALKLIRGIMTGDTECIEIVRLHYKKLSG